ncbi:MAG: DUF3313 family protein, partial [Pseudomonadota bacterium]
MTRINLKVRIASIALLSLGLVAAPLMAAEGWQQMEHPTLDMLFINSSVDMALYEQVSLEPVSVWYPAETQSAADRAERLRTSTVAEFGRAFAAGGLELTEADADGDLLVRVQLIDFTNISNMDDVLEWQRRFKFSVEPGRVTMVVELIDAQTGQAIVRIADMQEGSSVGLS